MGDIAFKKLEKDSLRYNIEEEEDPTNNNLKSYKPRDDMLTKAIKNLNSNKKLLKDMGLDDSNDIFQKRLNKSSLEAPNLKKGLKFSLNKSFSENNVKFKNKQLEN